MTNKVYTTVLLLCECVCVSVCLSVTPEEHEECGCDEEKHRNETDHNIGELCRSVAIGLWGVLGNRLCVCVHVCVHVCVCVHACVWRVKVHCACARVCMCAN